MTFISGHWSTLDVPGTSHNLLASLSDVHLVYMGEGQYTLLCKQKECTTTEIQFNDHDSQRTQLTLNTAPPVKHLQGSSEGQMSPQKDIDTSGVYSDNTEIYNLDEGNTSSETIIQSTDTELCALDEYNIDSLMVTVTRAEAPKEPK